MDEDSEPIIMDLGSGHLKAGFANDDSPKCNIPMIVGKPKSPDIMVGMDQKDAYYGAECLSKIEMLNLFRPV
jgi:actin